MVDQDIIYKMAFSFLKKKINVDFLNEISSKEITYQGFFNLPTKELINKLGILPTHEFDKIVREEALMKARKEYDRISAHNIKPLFVLDDDYPRQLAEIFDPPLIMYELGDADLEGDRMVAVVGTRKPTNYGLNFCNKIVEEISDYFPDATVVSGLAYGIDAIAHKKAIEKGITTIAVLAHGLNMIYPAAHRSLAKEIIREGGALLSEYPFDTQPFKPNFLARNRIVAGLCNATIVVESDIKGGAMSTANYAFMYNRDVLALPGRSSDQLSSGCNLLIRKNKAHLIENCADFIETTGWQPLNITIDTRQRNLFPELEGDAKKIYELLKFSEKPLQVDNIGSQLSISITKLLPLLGELEYDGIIMRLPGNRFSIS